MHGVVLSDSIMLCLSVPVFSRRRVLSFVCHNFVFSEPNNDYILR